MVYQIVLVTRLYHIYKNHILSYSTTWIQNYINPWKQQSYHISNVVSMLVKTKQKFRVDAVDNKPTANWEMYSILRIIFRGAIISQIPLHSKGFLGEKWTAETCVRFALPLALFPELLKFVRWGGVLKIFLRVQTSPTIRADGFTPEGWSLSSLFATLYKARL